MSNKSRLSSIRDLETSGLISDSSGLEAVAKTYAIGITDSVLETIGPSANDPVRLQYVPQARELENTPDELNDPIGDEAHSPVPGIVHRYPDRVLFKAANACAVYCRYCFRRGMLKPGAKGLTPEEMNSAFDYIRSHKDIWEVILTGGDPLILSARKLEELLDTLCAIDHVKVIRIHSRVPIADSGRITPSVLKALNRNKPIYIVVHINHENEITPAVEKTFSDLRAAGCTLLSQSVLLKNVNDNAQTLENLFRRLITLKVKPYYLHHPDLAPGTSHFRLSIEEGQNIMRALRGRVSGICLPEYMLDIPGGHGKVPLTPNYLHGLDESAYEIEDFRGHKHTYSK
jgi:lysine 2,3-aminomutase